jgi:cellulose synthase (UDP-forming)
MNAISEHRRLNRLAVFSSAFVLAFICLFSTIIELSIENQLVLSAALLICMAVIHNLRFRTGEFGRILFITIGTYLSLRYWSFRTTGTIFYSGAVDSVFLMLLYLAETYGIFTHLMGVFVNLVPLRNSALPLPRDPNQWPIVDVFVPTYNEPPEIVNITLAACTQLDYPKEKLNIYVLDDGGTDAKLGDTDAANAQAAAERASILKNMAAELGIHYRTRADNRHAKAGNINAALRAAVSAPRPGSPSVGSAGGSDADPPQGELILVLDSDHVPTKDFLMNTVGFFLADEKLAFVQTPHFFINPTPVERNLETYKQNPNENEMFYGGIHLGLNFWNASFFCGSAAMLRRSCLMAVGGVAEDTITEDAATAITLHSKGYNSIYLNKPMVMGLAPESFDGFVIQRSRWARGMTQIMLLKNPLRHKGLTLSQRICYLNACLYWLFGFTRIIFFVSPLLFLFFLLRVYNASLEQVMVYAVPHLIASYFIANVLYGRLRHPFFSELYETIQSIYLAPAVLSVFLRPRSPKFRVTPKSIDLTKEGPTHLAIVFYIMFLLTLLAYPLAFYHWTVSPSFYGTILICLTWNTFNMLMMLCCLGVVWERKQQRRSHRVTTREHATLRAAAGGGSIEATIVDLSLGGVALLVDPDATLALNAELKLIATNSYGKSYELPVAIKRVADQAGKTLIGCTFDLSDQRVYQEVVGFVFGDSRRWKYFFERQSRSTVNSFSGFIYLVKIGVKGSIRSFIGMWRLIWRTCWGWLTIILSLKRQVAE